MIAWPVLNTGFSRKIISLGLWCMGTAIIIMAFWLALDRYGDARYDAGVSDTDAAWKDAVAASQAESVKAAGAADEQAQARAIDFASRVHAERERIDEAVGKGDSPLDVLFGNGGVSKD